VEGASFVVERLARHSFALFSSAQRPEILRRLGGRLSVESHHDAASYKRSETGSSWGHAMSYQPSMTVQGSSEIEKKNKQNKKG